MATKKQKRLAALEKRAEFEAEVKRTGLEALEKDRALREAQSKRIQEDAMRVNRRKKTLKSAKQSGQPA